jgi:hypothetical protein
LGYGKSRPASLTAGAGRADVMVLIRPQAARRVRCGGLLSRFIFAMKFSRAGARKNFAPDA